MEKMEQISDKADTPMDKTDSAPDKPEQVLVLEPANELKFRGPFTKIVTSNLDLHNPTNRRICFKVKTTAPKRYCVRPNSGIVEPKSTVQVAVMLQPFEYDPMEKNKHKFMVQSMFAPDGNINAEKLWKEANPDSLMDSKLRCVFELSPESSDQNNLDVSSPNADESLKPNIAKSGSPDLNRSPKTNNLEIELRRATDECKRLRDELAFVKQENIQLKDEGIRQRIVRTSLPSESGTRTNIQHLQPTNSFPPIMFVVLAIVLGLLVGKFVL